ncbi:MAG TPA: hypothetical protein VK579_06280 [Terriglobales bacterium]|nr:hypothetical protein [Terriglobales bacterium]
MAKLCAWIDGGRPQFNNLLFHRGEVSFLAFDLLMSDGRDLRTERLADRKHELRRLLSKTPESRMRYVEHVEQYGTALFQRVCNIPLPTTRAFALSPVVSAGPLRRSSAPITPKILPSLVYQLRLRLQPSSFTPSLNPRSGRTKFETTKQNP